MERTWSKMETQGIDQRLNPTRSLRLGNGNRQKSDGKGHAWILPMQPKHDFKYRHQIWLNCEWQSENAILVLKWLESDKDLITRDIECFLLFPKVICTLLYDKWFKIYVILKLAGLLEFCSEQICIVWEIWTFDQKQMESQETFYNRIVDNVLSFPTVVNPSS
jgi:hypothetical protein